MSRAEVARLGAGVAYAVTLACAWLLLPDEVEVVLGEADVLLERWQYVVGAGLVGWAMAVGTGGLGLGLGALARSFATGAPDPGSLSTWLEAWVLVCACAYVWLQVAAGDAASPAWWQLGVVLVGFAGAGLLVALHARSVRRRSPG